MQPRNVRIACLILIFTSLLLRQRSFVIQQMYCFALMEEAFRISRRNRLMLLMCMAGLSQQQRPQLRRRAWVWPRPQNWFRLLIANPALHFLWKEHFRITHETFEYLCDLVRADLQKQQTRMQAPISVEERVGLALWRLTIWISNVNSEIYLQWIRARSSLNEGSIHKISLDKAGNYR